MQSNRLVTLLSIASLLLLSSPARAHGEKGHGQVTDGSITAIAGDAMVVETPGGSVSVALDANTQVTAGDRPATRAALTNGAHVMVTGSKLPSGEIAAREVMVHAPGEQHGGGH